VALQAPPASSQKVRHRKHPLAPSTMSVLRSFNVPHRFHLAAALDRFQPRRPSVRADAHIDGLHTPTNGVPEGELHNFTVLLGVALTDAPTPNMGNFGYIPCSHAALARALPDEAAALALGVAGAARWKEALGIDLGLLAPPQALWYAPARIDSITCCVLSDERCVLRAADSLVCAVSANYEPHSRQLPCGLCLLGALLDGPLLSAQRMRHCATGRRLLPNHGCRAAAAGCRGQGAAQDPAGGIDQRKALA